MFCSVYYQSQVHSKYFCVVVSLENIIPLRLLVTIIYTCKSIIHLSDFFVVVVSWLGLNNFLQFELSGKPV